MSGTKRKVDKVSTDAVEGSDGKASAPPSEEAHTKGPPTHEPSDFTDTTDASLPCTAKLPPTGRDTSKVPTTKPTTNQPHLCDTRVAVHLLCPVHHVQ